MSVPDPEPEYVLVTPATHRSESTVTMHLIDDDGESPCQYDTTDHHRRLRSALRPDANWCEYCTGEVDRGGETGRTLAAALERADPEEVGL